MSEAMGAQPTIHVDDLWVKFAIHYHRRDATLRERFVGMLPSKERNGHARVKDFWALSAVNLTVRPGEVVGLLGRNGAGKTTLLKCLAGICTADRGSVSVRGKVACLMSFGVGFKPNLSGRENAYLNGSLLGLSRRRLDACMADIIEFSEIGDFIDAPVRTYSAGMKGRLGFSIAVHVQPDVLLLDEVLTVGDASFRAKAGSILERYRSDKKTVVIASHSVGMLRKQCTRVLWLERGKVHMRGKPRKVIQAYMAENEAEKTSDRTTGDAPEGASELPGER